MLIINRAVFLVLFCFFFWVVVFVVFVCCLSLFVCFLLCTVTAQWIVGLLNAKQ